MVGKVVRIQLENGIIVLLFAFFLFVAFTGAAFSSIAKWSLQPLKETLRDAQALTQDVFEVKL